MTQDSRAAYVSVFAPIENSKREDNPELFARFERLLGQKQDESDNEELINVEFVKHLRKQDSPGMLAWQVVWHENNGKNVFGAFYQSPYQDEAVEFVSFIKLLDIVQKQVQVVDVTYYLPNGLPFHTDFKYDFVDHEEVYL